MSVAPAVADGWAGCDDFLARISASVGMVVFFEIVAFIGCAAPGYEKAVG
jgi:hypothetical protein